MNTSNLNTKNLMIGDWVYNTHNKQNEQVEEVGSNCVMLAYNDLYAFDEIEPIPLTPEILGKNGFRIIFDGELHVSYFQDIESFHTEVKVDKIGIYQKLSMLDGLGNGVTIVECKYVHQLQHALRLCGIEKEIEL